MFLSIRGD